MGQKVSPHGLRVGIIKDWDSKWYADKKDIPKLLVEDHKIREYLNKSYFNAGISRIYIDRIADKVIQVTLFTAKPGMIVGKAGATIKEIRETIQKMTGKQIRIDVSEVVNPDSDSKLLAESVADSIERRISFRRAMKQAISRSLKTGNVKGVKIQVSGRLNGADMARTEGYSEGNVPLSTLRADIDYGFAEADTTYGKIGVKVWLYKGEILSKKNYGKTLIRTEAKKKNSRQNNKNRKPRGRRKPSGDRKKSKE